MAAGCWHANAKGLPYRPQRCAREARLGKRRGGPDRPVLGGAAKRGRNTESLPHPRASRLTARNRLWAHAPDEGLMPNNVVVLPHGYNAILMYCAQGRESGS